MPTKPGTYPSMRIGVGCKGEKDPYADNYDRVFGKTKAEPVEQDRKDAEECCAHECGDCVYKNYECDYSTVRSLVYALVLNADMATKAARADAALAELKSLLALVDTVD